MRHESLKSWHTVGAAMFGEEDRESAALQRACSVGSQYAREVGERWGGAPSPHTGMQPVGAMQFKRAQYDYFYGERQKKLVDEALARIPDAMSAQRVHEELEGLAKGLQGLQEYERCALERMGPAELKRNYRQAAILKPSEWSISCMCVLSDGRLVSGDHSGTLRVWREHHGGTWDNDELFSEEGVVDRILAMPGEGFASITNAYTDDGAVFSSMCFVWREDASGAWQGTELPLEGAKNIRLSLLPNGGMVSLANRTAAVWRRDGDGKWHCTELGKTVHTYAVLPDSRVVVANYATSSIEVWGEQANGSWAEQKILIDTFCGTESLRVLRCGRIVSKHGGFWSDGSQVFVLAEQPSGAWGGVEVHPPEHGRLGMFEALPSGIIAAQSGESSHVRLWRETSGGQWMPWEIDESEIDISNLHELPSGWLAEQLWQGAIVLWQPGDAGDWRRSELWRAGPGEDVRAFRVLPGEEIVSVIKSRRLDDDDYPAREECRLMILRKGEEGSFSREEAALDGVSRTYHEEPAHLDVKQTKIAALPDGKLVVRLGTNQLFIFDGDPAPGALR